MVVSENTMSGLFNKICKISENNQNIVHCTPLMVVKLENFQHSGISHKYALQRHLGWCTQSRLGQFQIYIANATTGGARKQGCTKIFVVW